jgi:hypothetical protein
VQHPSRKLDDATKTDHELVQASPGPSTFYSLTIKARQPHPILLLNGWPGIGKLTTANQLVTLLGGPSHARLIHNHLLIDAADATLPRDSPSYQSLRQSLRACILHTVSTSPDSFNTTYIFTEFQSDNKLGRGVLAEYRAAAEKRGSGFVQVNLDCELEENVRRMTDERRTSAGKYVHDDNLRKWRRDNRLAPCEGGNFVRMERIDVGKLQPEETAVWFKSILDLNGQVNEL